VNHVVGEKLADGERRCSMNENDVEGPRRDTALTTAIIVFGVIVLACVLAFTVITVVFFINAPW
jgi:hypothetical protein